MSSDYFLVINGKRVQGEEESLAVINPASGKPYASAPVASRSQLDEAVAAAQEAFKTWRLTSLAERKEALLKIGVMVAAHGEELARIIVQEQGKPLAVAQGEVGGALAWIEATAALELAVEVVEEMPDKRIEIHRKPLGVVGSITPWNWPLLIAVWHVMPAILAGNTVVCKPSELTPLNTLRLFDLIADILPPGVLNVVSGGGEIGAAMSAHSGINKIVFTGSTPTGQKIMSGAAGNLKRLTLELGGNDAGIVLPDADVDDIAEGVFAAGFLNMGQTCAALKRLYVHDSVYDDMCEKLADIAAQQVVGNGLDEGVSFGPVQNSRQLEIVTELVEDAKAQGGRVLAGGQRIDQEGYFYPPTIIADVTDGMRLVDEEQFGPVLPVIRYTDVEDVIARANQSDVGLGGSVWSGDIERAIEVAGQIESGSVWINSHGDLHPQAPFGGCKMSGVGVEFGQHGLLEYTSIQTLHINK